MNFLVKLTLILACGSAFLFEAPLSSFAKEPERILLEKEPSITVILQRYYVDGEVSEEIITEKVTNIEAMLKLYQDWQLVERDDSQLVMQKRIDDISPLLKTSGYFGVSKQGMLQLYRGVPHSNNAIHSFFQLDMKKLESYRKEQLERGIRVKSKKKYEQVLETLQQYSVK
ncbi:BofC C-terminal domain-containing protein [Ectobacillus polymachus]|uniref:BofC C-terminal domain-containing protein n=1 Tax=Ectobacillus polymachus TaxID=1508806 RepID=UPI003A8B013D